MNESTLQLWPLVLIIEDTYRPESAGFIIEGIEALPEEAFSLVFGFAADRAREEVTCN